MLAPAPRRPNGPPGAATKGHGSFTKSPKTKKKTKTKPRQARITKPVEPDQTPEERRQAALERIKAHDLEYREMMFNAFGPEIFGENWPAIEAYRSRSSASPTSTPGGSDIGASSRLESGGA